MENLERSIHELKENTKIKKIYGILGIPINGQRTVEVPNREGFVYVRLRDNQSELIQAINSAVSPVYDLPVVLVREGNRYKVEGRDTERYQTWGSFSSFIPRHGDQHSFNEGVGGGGDITWVNGKQFMPMLVMPSGSLGANNVVISDYRIQDDATGWIYSGGTGTPNLLTYKPTNNNAVMILVYVDQTTGNPGFIVGSGSYFANTITGSAQVNPYIPANPSSDYLPAMAVRLSSGTSVIGWDNLYDVRQYYGGSGGGASTGSSFSGIPVQDEGVPIGTGTVFNFVGNNVDVSVSGTVIRVFVTGSAGSSLPSFITGSVPYAASNGILKEDNTKISFDEQNITLWVGEKFSLNSPSTFRLMLRATGTNSSVAMGVVTAGTGSSGGTSSPVYGGYRSRGTFESPTAVSTDDILINIFGAGHDGTQYINSAAIRMRANAPFVGGVDTSSKINFEVTPSGSNTRIAKMTLYGDSVDLINSGTYNINGVPHTHPTASSDGWNPPAGTWTYSSTDDPTGIIISNTDETNEMGVGDRIKFVNGGNTIYGIVTRLVLTTGTTAITFCHQIDPADNLAVTLMANSAITVPKYSHVKNPYGFPSSKTSWRILIKDTNNQSQATPSTNIYNLGSLQIVVPIGEWTLSSFSLSEAEVNLATTQNRSVRTGLSTANNTFSDLELYAIVFLTTPALATATARAGISLSKVITLTSKTTYFLNCGAGGATAPTSISFRGDLGTTRIMAELSYL